MPACCALCFLLINRESYNLPFHPHFGAFLFFATVLVYGGQRFVKSYQGLLPEERLLIYQKNLILWFFILMTAFGMALLFALKMPFTYTYRIWPAAVISIAYVWSPVKKGLPLRQTLLKSFIVALVWSYMTVLLPAMYENRSFDEFLLPLISRGAFVLGLVLPFDALQKEFDSKKGITTLPVILGPRELFYFYLILWLVVYMGCEITGDLLSQRRLSMVTLCQNIWVACPLFLFRRISERNVWLYDVMPFLALANLMIAKSFCS